MSEAAVHDPMHGCDLNSPLLPSAAEKMLSRPANKTTGRQEQESGGEA